MKLSKEMSGKTDNYKKELENRLSKESINPESVSYLGKVSGGSIIAIHDKKVSFINIRSSINIVRILLIDEGLTENTVEVFKLIQDNNTIIKKKSTRHGLVKTKVYKTVKQLIEMIDFTTSDQYYYFLRNSKLKDLDYDEWKSMLIELVRDNHVE